LPVDDASRPSQQNGGFSAIWTLFGVRYHSKHFTARRHDWGKKAVAEAAISTQVAQLQAD